MQSAQDRQEVEGDMPAIRVLIVDDHDMVATALQTVMDRSPRIDVVGMALDEAAALEAAERLRPDVMVIDFMLGSTRSPSLFGPLQEAADGCAIVVLTGWASEGAMLESFDAGASGFLSKDQSMTMLVEGVIAAAEGEVVVAPDLMAFLAARSRTGGRDPSVLTRRELEIVELMARGVDTKAMAESLNLSVHTVRNHVAKISMRLGAHSRLEAVTEAIRRGIISPPIPDQR